MRPLFLPALLALSLAACNAPDQLNGADTSAKKSDTSSGPAQATIGASYFLEDLLDISSEAELKERYGAENVKRDTIWLGEGEFTIGTKLYPGSDKEVELSWRDTMKFEELLSAKVEAKWTEGKREGANRWRSKTGIRLGSTSAELQELNGKPFKFLGFGWDYAGTLSNWEGGALDKKNVFVVLGEPATYDEKGYESLLGDKELKSDDVEVKKMNPVVVELAVAPGK